MRKSKLLHRLSPAPVLGVPMNRVTLLRLDLTGGSAPGNKSFKLAANLACARKDGFSRVLSFGGAWSNHLHALAALGREQGFDTVGVVRGEPSATPSAMLLDAANWGMHLHHVSRSEYRKRQDPQYLATLHKQFGSCYIIPEGGANDAGVRGAREIAGLVPAAGRIVLPVGTGTTLAGLAAGVDADTAIVGISVLKEARDLNGQVAKMLDALDLGGRLNWTIEHDWHCGGYARVNTPLKSFILEFERVHRVLLDPVYTGKALFAVHQKLARGELDGETIAVHTGGLQGRRGFSWLDAVTGFSRC
jgi:1-aminocyclopropane-1-carboxylate deaminase